ncbi:MAG: chorismate mutase [Nitriliruptorales bacterium]
MNEQQPATAGTADHAGVPRMRAIRGATTLEQDSREQALMRTQELLGEIFRRNELDQDDVVSILFTATDDVSGAYPAEAAREAGFNLVPLLCARELEIEGGIPLCIRVLLHVQTTRTPAELRHVYLHDARQLRTDLPE